MLRSTWDSGWAWLGAQWHLRGATVGGRVRVWGSPSIRNHGELVIGERVRLYSTIATIEITVNEGARLEIGDQTMINYGTSIGATQSIRIGRRCQIGTHCMIIDNDFHRLEPERRLEVPPSKPVVLEDDVWLAVRVLVLPGVTIGAGSVVAAGAVVTSSIPSRSLAAGVPAKVVRTL